MMQQLSFSPVENILTVLFAAAILGYLLYLLVRSLRNRQRGYHTVNRAKVFSKRQATAVNQPEVSDRIYGELQEGDCASLSCRDGKLVSFGALQNRDDRERSFRG